MLRQIKVDLSNEYSITANEDKSNISVEIQKGQALIGKAFLVTDNVDVSCITDIDINDEHVNVKLELTPIQ